jgi:hypothetical protein
MSSVNRGKITSTNSTHPTAKSAKHIPVQRNANHTEPLSRSDLVREPILTDAARRTNGGFLPLVEDRMRSIRVKRVHLPL